MSIAILRTFVERRREEDAIAKANKKKKASEGPGGAVRGKSKRGGQQANVAQTSSDKEGINKPCDAGAGSSGNGVAGGDISVQSGANVEITEKEANETQCCASEPGPSDSRAALGLPEKHEQAPEGRSGSTDKENATGGASSSGPAMAKGRGLAPLKVLEVCCDNAVCQKRPLDHLASLACREYFLREAPSGQLWRRKIRQEDLPVA